MVINRDKWNLPSGNIPKMVDVFLLREITSRNGSDHSLISLLFCGFLGDHFPYFSSWKQQIFPDPPHLGVRFFPHDAKTIVLISLSLIFECLSYSFIAIFSQCQFRGSIMGTLIVQESGIPIDDLCRIG